MRVAVSIYGDFECYQPKCSEKHGKTSKYKSEHIPFGYGIYIKSDNKEIVQSYYQNETFDANVAKAFVKKLIEIRNEIENLPPEKIIFTEKDEENYNSATACWICEKGFLDEEENKNQIKVRDHCHFSGKCCGAAHSICNLQLREKTFIPVVFHNLKGYDSHIFIKAFSELEDEPDCIPQNTEKMISFSLKKKHSFELKFLDSYGFMGFSLSTLVGNLNEFPIMSSQFFPRGS